MTGRETPNLLFGGSMPHLAIGFLIFGGFFLLHRIDSFKHLYLLYWLLKFVVF